MPKDIHLATTYASIATCALGCPGVVNRPAEGIMGRSFYCPENPKDVTLLLVSKNPAISDPRENALYAPLDGPQRVVAHETFVRNRFLGTNTIITSRYHVNILSWVSVILGVPATHEAVFARAAKTAIVKCHSAGEKTDPLPDSTKQRCTSEHLYREIEVIRPRYLLALGGEAFEYLMRPAVRERHRLPVGQLYHPSWTNMRGGVARYIAEVLPSIRADYLRSLGSPVK